ncbi:hypothetical protein PSTT_12391 [Puccinia striiformis]|uniref:Concentrative nucleoside transporter C-terminal domain-containing protein n=1 Tax=Puccinia striiformis TaxID=27350 RepID=A0A2S4UWE1_9BASI|nr:hypothetical protein PSTT_12391 [Puccinia striiformis]
MASASKQSARGRIGDKLDESKACVCSGFSHFEHIELRPLPGGCLRLTLNMRTSTMAPTKQDQPDLNALENQGQVDGALGAGRSSSKSIAHSIPKSQEQTITEEKPISEALVVENDCTSLGSKPKDDRIGRQPKWWLSLIQWRPQKAIEIMLIKRDDYPSFLPMGTDQIRGQTDWKYVYDLDRKTRDEVTNERVRLGIGWASSKNKSLIRWRTVVVGLILQQLLALVVLKSKAGYDFFNWIATAATDILDQGTKAGGFFFSPEVVQNHWFFVNTLAAIIFFIALVQLLYYFGIMQAVMVKFAWVFYTLMGVSGVEAVVAAASPFVGQCNSYPAIRAQMTAAEIHQVMASGFSTIAGSVLTAYVAMGSPHINHEHTCFLSNQQARFPEDSRPLTAGQVVIPEDEQNNPKDSNPLMTFSDGAWLGLRPCESVNNSCIVIYCRWLLTWIGQFWGMDPNGTHPLTLELIFQYVLYPVAWLMGTPNQDVLKVSRLLALKLITNEFVAYQELSKLRPEMTERGILIAIYGLCGFANLGSMGIQIGVLNSLVPSKKDVISRVAISALLCGFFSTIQTAAMAGMIF